jgi:hypothetical protein
MIDDGAEHAAGRRTAESFRTLASQAGLTISELGDLVEDRGRDAAIRIAAGRADSAAAVGEWSPPAAGWSSTTNPCHDIGRAWDASNPPGRRNGHADVGARGTAWPVWGGTPFAHCDRPAHQIPRTTRFAPDDTERARSCVTSGEPRR